jgi:hypothetical protein
MFDDIAKGLESSALGVAISESQWAFPGIETVHVLSLALVFGSILMIDLRLLGISSRSSLISKLSAEVLPYTWTGFALAALSGGLLFISRAQTYIHNLSFQLKFVCMFLAFLNMLAFQYGAYRRVLDWDASLPPPRAARLAGALSLSLWLCVIFFGRWIGFTL